MNMKICKHTVIWMSVFCLSGLISMCRSEILYNSYPQNRNNLNDFNSDGPHQFGGNSAYISPQSLNGYYGGADARNTNDSYRNLQGTGNIWAPNFLKNPISTVKNDSENKLSALMEKLDTLLAKNDEENHGLAVRSDSNDTQQRSLLETPQNSPSNLESREVEVSAELKTNSLVNQDQKKKKSKLVRKIIDKEISRELHRVLNKDNIQALVRKEIQQLEEAKAKETLKVKDDENIQKINNVNLPSLDLRQYKQDEDISILYNFDDSNYDIKKEITSLDIMIDKIQECRIELIENEHASRHTESLYRVKKTSCCETYNITINILNGLDKWCLNVIYNHIFTETNIMKLTKYIDDFHPTGDINKDRAMINLNEFKQIYEKHHTVFNLQEYKNSYEYKVKFVQDFYQKKFKQQLETLRFMSTYMHNERSQAEFVEFDHLVGFLSVINTDLDSFEEEKHSNHSVQLENQIINPPEVLQPKIIIVKDFDDLKRVGLDDAQIQNIKRMSQPAILKQKLSQFSKRRSNFSNKTRLFKSQHRKHAIKSNVYSSLNDLAIEPALATSHEDMTAHPATNGPNNVFYDGLDEEVTGQDVHKFNNDIKDFKSVGPIQSQKPSNSYNGNFYLNPGQNNYTESVENIKPIYKLKKPATIPDGVLVHTDDPNYEQNIDDELKDVPDETGALIDHDLVEDDENTENRVFNVPTGILHPEVAKNLETQEAKNLLKASDSESDEHGEAAANNQPSEAELSQKLKELLGKDVPDYIISGAIEARNRKSPLESPKPSIAVQTLPQSDSNNENSIEDPFHDLDEENIVNRLPPDFNNKITTLDTTYNSPTPTKDLDDNHNCDEDKDIAALYSDKAKNENDLSQIDDIYNDIKKDNVKNALTSDYEIQTPKTSLVPALSTQINQLSSSLHPFSAPSTSNSVPNYTPVASKNHIIDDEEILRNHNLKDEDLFSIAEAINHGKLEKAGMDTKEVNKNIPLPNKSNYLDPNASIVAKKHISPDDEEFEEPAFVYGNHKNSSYKPSATNQNFSTPNTNSIITASKALVNNPSADYSSVDAMPAYKSNYDIDDSDKNIAGATDYIKQPLNFTWPVQTQLIPNPSVGTISNHFEDRNSNRYDQNMGDSYKSKIARSVKQEPLPELNKDYSATHKGTTHELKSAEKSSIKNVDEKSSPKYLKPASIQRNNKAVDNDVTYRSNVDKLSKAVSKQTSKDDLLKGNAKMVNSTKLRNLLNDASLKTKSSQKQLLPNRSVNITKNEPKNALISSNSEQKDRKTQNINLKRSLNDELSNKTFNTKDKHVLGFTNVDSNQNMRKLKNTRPNGLRLKTDSDENIKKNSKGSADQHKYDRKLENSTRRGYSHSSTSLRQDNKGQNGEVNRKKFKDTISLKKKTERKLYSKRYRGFL